MMLQVSTQTNPIVEILRLAYRRGLAIQREREKANKAPNSQLSNEGILTTKPESTEKVQTNISK